MRFNQIRKPLTRFTAAYFLIGFVISTAHNLFGELSAFRSAASFGDQVTLLFWWFFVPAVMWPVDLFWKIYHKLI